MAKAFVERLASTEVQNLSFEERLVFLVTPQSRSRVASLRPVVGKRDDRL